MTKKRKRLKRRIRQLEHRLEQCYEHKRHKHPFDEHLSKFEREVSDLSPEVVGGEVIINAYRLLIHFELSNYARSIHVLTIHGTQSNAPYLLLRGMLEGLADLKCLCEQDSALDDMYMKYRTERLRVLKSAKAGNPQLQGLVDGDLDGLIREQEEAIDELATAGTKKRKSIRERFEEAGMEEDYDGWYAFFSGYVHKGLRNLGMRHLHQDKDGNWVFPPDLRRPWKKDEIDRLESTIDFILREARKELTDVGILED